MSAEALPPCSCTLFSNTKASENSIQDLFGDRVARKLAERAVSFDEIGRDQIDRLAGLECLDCAQKRALRGECAIGLARRREMRPFEIDVIRKIERAADR